jgi:hypothetical protein
MTNNNKSYSIKFNASFGRITRFIVCQDSSIRDVNRVKFPSFSIVPRPNLIMCFNDSSIMHDLVECNYNLLDVYTISICMQDKSLSLEGRIG